MGDSLDVARRFGETSAESAREPASAKKRLASLRSFIAPRLGYWSAVRAVPGSIRWSNSPPPSVSASTARYSTASPGPGAARPLGPEHLRSSLRRSGPWSRPAHPAHPT